MARFYRAPCLIRSMPKQAPLCRKLPAALVVLACAQAAAATTGAPIVPERSEPARQWEGAIGLVAVWSPDYQGAADSGLRLVPAGFIRYGRITLSGAGGFSTRRAKEVERGLDARLIDRERIKVSLGLHIDRGRSESSSPALRGLGDIKPTLRTRLSVRWSPVPEWTLATVLNLDALGRGGGYWASVGASRRWALTPATSLTVDGSLSFAGDQYLQTWYGVSAAQSARSGYAAFAPAEGLRDIGLSATLRTELTPAWAGFAGIGASRLLGSAVDAPFVRRPGAASVTGGLVWRF